MIENVEVINVFGVDWDGDGEDSLFDDMITMDILDEEDSKACGTPNGSCLLFLITIGSALALPVAGLVKFLI